MKIFEIQEEKEKYMPLLLLADEQERMVRRYLNRGTMYVLEENGVKVECVVTEEGQGILEIKNLATVPEFQKQGYGRKMIDFLVEKYAATHVILQVGTGDSPLTIPFYKKCGFIRSHVLKNFFTENYDHPIIEDGVVLKDMIYFRRKLQ